jgi:hypothetical protein
LTRLASFGADLVEAGANAERVGLGLEISKVELNGTHRYQRDCIGPVQGTKHKQLEQYQVFGGCNSNWKDI